MPFAIGDEHLPAILRSEPMTDDQFTEYCAEHPDLFFEMTAEGELIVMAPTHSTTGLRSLAIGTQLGSWAQQDNRGFACDSSTGFVLPNGARRSPDASWTLKHRVAQLEIASREGFWRLCPDFVIELQSKSDRARVLSEKMLEYMANGAQLGWLIDPAKRAVTVYRSSGEMETRTDIASISGEGPVAGFTLQLSTVWNPLEA